MPKPRKVATPVNNLTKVDSDTSGEGGFVFKRKLRNTAEGRRALYADLDKQAEQLSKDFRAHTQSMSPMLASRSSFADQRFRRFAQLWRKLVKNLLKHLF